MLTSCCDANADGDGGYDGIASGDGDNARDDDSARTGQHSRTTHPSSGLTLVASCVCGRVRGATVSFFVTGYLCSVPKAVPP